LTFTFETACSCFAGIVSLGTLLIAFLAWRVAKNQLTENLETTKASNSLEILSWFDEPYIREVLENIEDRAKMISQVDNKGILDLLYILDTVCSLIKSGRFDKSLLFQMNDLFRKINSDGATMSVYNINRAYFSDLDFTLLIDSTSKKDNVDK